MLENNEPDDDFNLYINTTSNRVDVELDIAAREYVMNSSTAISDYTASCVNFLEMGYDINKLEITDNSAPIVKLKRDMLNEFGISVEPNKASTPTKENLDSVLAPGIKRCVSEFIAENNYSKSDLPIKTIDLKSRRGDDQFYYYSGSQKMVDSCKQYLAEKLS
jgi:hypothetical protein